MKLENCQLPCFLPCGRGKTTTIWVTLTTHREKQRRAVERMRAPSIQASGSVVTYDSCAATSLSCFMRHPSILIMNFSFFLKLVWVGLLSFSSFHKNPSLYKELPKQREGEGCFRGLGSKGIKTLKKWHVYRNINSSVLLKHILALFLSLILRDEVGYLSF